LLSFAPACSSDDAADDDNPAADAGSTDGGSDASSGADATSADTAGPPPGNATFGARGSVHQVFVIHALPQQNLDLRDADGKSLAKAVADKLGSHVFRKVPAAKNYRVHDADKPGTYSNAVDVLTIETSKPKQSFYDKQVIKPGTGYITTRDGTTLSYFATLPGPLDKGPYPTIINYSGYSPSRPGQPVVPKGQESLCDAVPVLCNAPSDATAMIAAVAGYATVSVNIRGTGCSGGAYDYFETMQLLDGYDVVETVAAQPWVKGHKVGMTGLSYPGITQLFVARMNPPGLAAITPLSVIGNTVTTLVPGGILNNGFALNWINNVLKKAAPYGQGWEKKKVDAGDKICAENQLLHDQRVNNVEQAKDSTYYNPAIIDPLNPTLWVKDIKVPVFLAGAWQDEQTGPFFVELLDRFKGAPNRRFMLYNGLHSDGFAPQVLIEWKAFLDIYVAEQKPTMPGFMTALVPQLTTSIFGKSMSFPPDRWKKVKDHKAAKAQWEAEPEVQAVFENGAVDPVGTPKGAFTLPFAKWPPAKTKATRWYFHEDGALADIPSEATEGSASSFKLDPDAGLRGLKVSGGLWKATPKYSWRRIKPEYEVAFVTPPMTEDVVMLGTGSVDLWLRSAGKDIKDADVEVNLSEVRTDGKERYVQSGWLRASFRKLSKDATELWPTPSLLKESITPLEPGKWAKLRVAIPGFGHVFRKGSQIRIAIDTPGDSRVDWRFELVKFAGDASYDIGHSKQYGSSIVLPVIEGAAVPASAKLPPCPSLRGQQCRTYKPHKNTPAAP